VLAAYQAEGAQERERGLGLEATVASAGRADTALLRID